MNFPIYSYLRAKAEPLNNLNSEQILYLSKVVTYIENRDVLDFIYVLIYHHSLVEDNYDGNKIPYAGSCMIKTGGKNSLGIGPTFKMSNLPPLLIKILYTAIAELTT